MIKALDPRTRRGWWWPGMALALALALTLGLAGGWLMPARARAQGASGSARKAAAAAKGADAPPARNEAAPAEGKQAPVEIFKDPNAEKALEIFKSVRGLRAPNPRDLKAIKTMAGTPNANVDRPFLERFVSGMAYELTDKTNINALIDPPPNLNPRAAAARAVQDATDNLLDVFHTARLAKNTAFLAEYNRVLLDILPKLLDNNLIARLQAMIVLAQTGNPNAIPVFVRELKNPDQTIWVKSMAARGLTNAVENGVRVDSISFQPIDVARTIADLLRNGDDLPWPVQMRLLEALGAMRVSSQANSVKAEMATVAMTYLADAKARPEVRAEAARALGMMRASGVRDYNYALIAYSTGELVAELGDRIVDSGSKALAEYYSGLLITPLYQAFYGMDGARESGLLKAPGNPSLANVREIASRTVAVTRAAVELTRMWGTGKESALKKDLMNQVADLKSLLDKSAPKNFRLVPNGNEFRLQNAEVAKAAPEEGAGGTVGRRGR